MKKAATKKKPAKVKKGIHLRKSAKGRSLHIHSKNGNKLSVLTGYNTTQAAMKGLSALHKILNDHFNTATNKYEGIIDHTRTTVKVKLTKVTPRNVRRYNEKYNAVAFLKSLKAKK